MMKLLTLVLLLSTFSSLTLTEVVNSFIQYCPSFFIRNPENQNDIIIPTIFPGGHYKKICQWWEKKYRFATLYDTEKRIPVYSAYTFSEKVHTERSKAWKIEPQLDKDVEGYKSKRGMMDSPQREQAITLNIIKQAVNSDYTNTGYTRGHVFPNAFAANQDQANSTFTLTNIAPQTNDSNKDWAEQVEQVMISNISKNCRLDQNHKAYIVTGVVPGKKWIPITRNKTYEKGINIPSHFWSAFCCTSINNIKNLIGRAYLADLGDVLKVRQPTIHNLNKRLTELYNIKNIPFNVFPGLTL